MSVTRIYPITDGDYWILVTDVGLAYSLDRRLMEVPPLRGQPLHARPDRGLIHVGSWGGADGDAVSIRHIGPVSDDGSAAAQTVTPRTDFELSPVELSTLAALAQGKI